MERVRRVRWGRLARLSYNTLMLLSDACQVWFRLLGAVAVAALMWLYEPGLFNALLPGQGPFIAQFVREMEAWRPEMRLALWLLPLLPLLVSVLTFLAGGGYDRDDEPVCVECGADRRAAGGTVSDAASVT